MRAVVAVFCGMVIVKLADVLSEPKSRTAIDRLALLALYIKAQRAVTAAPNATLLKLT
jgi:hypothetical protein